MTTKSQIEKVIRRVNHQYFISTIQSDLKNLELRNQKQIAILNKIQILEQAKLSGNYNYDEIEKELKPFDDQIKLLNMQIKEQEDIADKIQEEYINYTLDRRPSLYV